MPIYSRSGGFQVSVRRQSALKGYRNIRKQVAGYDEAVRLEKEITSAIEQYGKWPVLSADRPLNQPNTTSQHGTLRETGRIVAELHWRGTDWGERAVRVFAMVRDFMEEHGKPNLDDITASDLDAYVTYMLDHELSSSYINKHLSCLSVVNKEGLRQGLCVNTLPIKRQPKDDYEKWWMTPEDHVKAIAFLHGNAEFMFADYLNILAYQGLRVMEGLRLTVHDFSGMDTDLPTLRVPGTKTARSEASIPVFPMSMETVRRSINRAQQQGQQRLFPLTWTQAYNRWQPVRMVLGAADIKTATMRSLRRTFANYANKQGMPTATLQKVLRHGNIQTTAGYLNLVGGGGTEDARRYFSDAQAAAAPDLQTAIAAYKATGASPADTASFVKALMAVAD